MNMATKHTKQSFKHSSLFTVNHDKLALMMPNEGISFEMDIWRFTYVSRGKDVAVTLDFDLFNKSHVKFANSFVATFDNQMTTLSCVDLAKILFLELRASAINDGLRVVLHNIARIFSYLNFNGVRQVETASLTELFKWMMLTVVEKTKTRQRQNAYAYHSTFAHINFVKLNGILGSIGLSDIVIDHTTRKQRQDAMAEATSTAAGISLADYMGGNHFDFLTLDVGRYYVEHAATLFEQQYLCARAISMTKASAPSIVNEIGLKWTAQDNIVTNGILSGVKGAALVEVDKSQSKYENGVPRTRVRFGKRLTTYRTMIFKRFKHHYKALACDLLLYSPTGLRCLTEELSLTNNRDTCEFLRAILLTETRHSSVKMAVLLQNLSPSLAYVDKTKNTITCEAFQIAKANTTAYLLDTLEVPELSTHYYEKLGIVKRQKTSDNAYNAHNECNTLCNYVEAAGVTQFVALTGWRCSEFGFPLQAIKVQQNKDTLDAVSRPLRFHVNWVVPKTHGNTKVDREISQSAYILAMQLHDWLTVEETAPCLYFYNGKSDSPFKNVSHGRIKWRVTQLWENFVGHYRSFVELRQLDALIACDTVPRDQMSEYKQLKQKYQPSTALTQLRHVMEKVENELPRLLARGFETSSDEISVKNSNVFAYLQGKMSKECEKEWDKYLNEDIKAYLHGLNAQTPQDIPRDAVKLVGSAFVNGCAYPTPHAFRHMWAEAVFRRYSGDVGWFIRSNFKHLSEAFFMHYLRNKDMRVFEERAKRQVINSVLTTHLLSQQHETREYAGRMDAYLTKVGRLTKVISLDELSKQVEQFTDLEISDIKSNSWGYCILKSRNQHRAKCAVDGIPQRHNASTSFCIGCTNNLIEQSHVTGIMLGIENHVQTLQIQELPDIFKREAKGTVSNALKELKTLDRNTKTQQNHKYINHLQSALASVEQ